MDLRTRRIVGAEALVRWIHPEFGTLPPDEFIPVAEKTGLIDPLTTIVLDEALAQRQRWAEAGLALGIAVNVSVRTLGDPWLPEKIAAALAKAGCPAEALTIEITESQLMADVSRAAGALERISDLGVAVSIDDFGTGFSSLSSLRALPLHEIKIDKSFVLRLDEDDNDAVIVRSTAELGRNLGLRVVAEGVENDRSLDILTEFGVDVAQGYLLSKPLSARDFERWIAGRNRSQAAVA
jgi:EAL domain-containing protein (putative c-di-GMP-specific phosphodiesterase class I)